MDLKWTSKALSDLARLHEFWRLSTRQRQPVPFNR